MKSKTHTMKGLLAISCLALGLMYSQSHAAIVMVYSKGDNVSPTLAEMKDVLISVKAKWNASSENDGPSYSDDRYGSVVKNSNILSREFSVGPGISAYIWSDKPIDGDPGFEMLGNSLVIDAGSESVAAKKAVKAPDLLVMQTMLSQIQIQGSNLHLDYALTTADEVRVEVFGMKGQSLGKWTWGENSSGRYSKDLSLDKIPHNGLLFVRWESGDVHRIQKVVTGK